MVQLLEPPVSLHDLNQNVDTDLTRFFFVFVFFFADYFSHFKLFTHG